LINFNGANLNLNLILKNVKVKINPGGEYLFGFGQTLTEI
jgi:hypothetical protein